MKWIFCKLINIKFSDKLIPLILLGMTGQHTQFTHNNKFAKFLQNLKREVRDKVDYLCVARNAKCIQKNKYIVLAVSQGQIEL